MNSAQMELLLSARDSIAVAKILLDSAYPDHAASRAYYAMFYVAEAFLEGEGLAFSKHSAVISSFGKEFAKPGKVPVEFHRILADAQDLRHIADYGPRNFVDPEQAKEKIEQAERFLEVAQEIIGKIPAE
jgi:uncharacterized protein (UPF0332 family)